MSDQTELILNEIAAELISEPVKTPKKRAKKEKPETTITMSLHFRHDGVPGRKEMFMQLCRREGFTEFTSVQHDYKEVVTVRGFRNITEYRSLTAKWSDLTIERR